METERIFAKYGTLIIDITHQQCMFIKGDYPTDYDKPDIVINNVPIKYINFGIPLDNLLIFHDPHADQSLDINDRPNIKVRYDEFSVVMHNDPDNPRSYMDFRNVELLTPFDFETKRFITWEEYDKQQQQKLESHVCDFDQIHRMIHGFGLTKSGKNMPNPAIIRNEEGFETIDFRFLVRWHTLNPETQEPDTWPVYEDLKAFIFSDESRMNIWILRNGKHIKDQKMHRWSIDFGTDGSITNVSEAIIVDALEPNRPCDQLIKLIRRLYNDHHKSK